MDCLASAGCAVLASPSAPVQDAAAHRADEDATTQVSLPLESSLPFLEMHVLLDLLLGHSRYFRDGRRKLGPLLMFHVF